MKAGLRNGPIVVVFLALLGACGSPEGNVSGAKDRYQTPVSPPRSHYRIDARIDLEDGVAAGRETITLRNSSTIPLTTVALAWTISDTSSLDVSVGGKKLAPRTDEEGARRKSPVSYVLPHPIAPGGKLVLDVSFNEKIETAKAKAEFLTSTWYPRSFKSFSSRNGIVSFSSAPTPKVKESPITIIRVTPGAFAMVISLPRKP